MSDSTAIISALITLLAASVDWRDVALPFARGLAVPR
jgi:hypothetical protein